ncbi:hypothetical protein CDN99_00255 [Roseateles aquatilis]|uniref:Uncharacterized protein n=2 Tax=Roseateles aquatilis TaxID=431061 RepID=A0A246JK48_9BURK|nr:hypothetical protein CDN99_00255 [Roseateles aquatilis]
MYAVSLGLIAAGVASTLIERVIPVGPSYELTAIGYLLGAGGLILLTMCLAATVESWLKARRRRASQADDPGWKQRAPRVFDHH